MTSSFPATRWSIIAAAGAGGEKATAQKALAELCRVYWFPLYTFARRKGLSPEDPETAIDDELRTLSAVRASGR